MATDITDEDHEENLDYGEDNEREAESIYSDDAPDSLLDDDGISPEEAAFMNGYSEE